MLSHKKMSRWKCVTVLQFQASQKQQHVIQSHQNERWNLFRMNIKFNWLRINLFNLFRCKNFNTSYFILRNRSLFVRYNLKVFSCNALALRRLSLLPHYTKSGSEYYAGSILSIVSVKIYYILAEPFKFNCSMLLLRCFLGKTWDCL